MTALETVVGAAHPTPEAGGPCATCAVRRGSEANGTAHTMALLEACVQGLRPFLCHEQPGLCRGWIAAVNLQGVPPEPGREVAALLADYLGSAISDAAEADRASQGATA